MLAMVCPPDFYESCDSKLIARAGSGFFSLRLEPNQELGWLMAVAGSAWFAKLMADATKS